VESFLSSWSTLTLHAKRTQQARITNDRFITRIYKPWPPPGNVGRLPA
jgi:hypothetical protein